MKLRPVQVISGKGSGPDQFTSRLRGIAVDRSDLVYAAGDREVKVFDADGKLQRRWRTAKLGRCLAFDANGDVYVGESAQVEQFTAAGKLVKVFRDAPRLGNVTAIALPGEHILLADVSNRRIRRYDLEGRWLNDIGADNNTRGFMVPNGHLDFNVDANGVIHAVNPGKHRIERYTPGGKLLGHFGRFGTHRPEDFPGCCNPTNLALTPGGEVIVTEKAAPRLKVYSADGKLLALVGGEAFDPNCKNMDIAVDSKGRIYVVDTVRLHIRVFEAKTKDHTNPAVQGAASQ